jgi:HEAT repeat protein
LTQLLTAALALAPALAVTATSVLTSGCATMREAARAQQRAEAVVSRGLIARDRDERLQAARIAAEVADPTLDRELAQRLGDGDAAVRATAAAALARATPPALELLCAALEGNDATARVIAIDAVRLMPDWRGRLARLAHDPDLRVRARVATAIGQLHPPEAHALLTSLLHDADAGVRGQALYGLAALDDRAALDEVTRALDDADLGVRLAALAALVRLDHDDVSPRLLALGSGSDRYLAARAAVHLSRAGERAAALAAVANAAHDGDAAVRRAALNAAGELGDDGAALATTALSDGDAEVRLDAARACLALHRMDRARAVLLALLDHPATRLDAATELARLGDARGVALLRHEARAPEPRRRARALSHLLPLPAGRDLLAPALDDSDGAIRLAAAAIVLQRAFRDPH